MTDFQSATRQPRTAPASPVLIAVPHAGRTYPEAMRALARLDAKSLLPLEDRFADLLAMRAAASGHGTMVADVARAWIDLNRDENELDPAVVAKPHGSLSFRTTTKARGGLGIVPSRIQSHGQIWRAPLAIEDVTARITEHHRPWHSHIASALAARRAHFGVAILIDLHSMPPIRDWRTSGPVPRLVIGDLHGQSASRNVTDAMLQRAGTFGLPISRNHPYAGGHTLARHGRPGENIHALQLEIDRSLYLDADLDQPGAGLPAMQALIGHLCEDIAARLVPLPIAAE